MRKPLPLEARENEHLIDILMELGLEMKGHTSDEFGLNNSTKQNLSKDVKRLDRNE